MVDKVRRYTPRPRQAAQEAIEAYIIRNQMKGNDKFPPERTMCQMWGLNRSTLRSTLARMVSDGRVHAVQGSGTCFTPGAAGSEKLYPIRGRSGHEAGNPAAGSFHGGV